MRGKRQGRGVDSDGWGEDERQKTSFEKVLAPALFDPWGCACMVLSHFSRVQLFATPWAVAGQALPSMGFSRQEYWRALPGPPPGDLPDPGIKPTLPALQADSLPTEPPGKRSPPPREVTGPQRKWLSGMSKQPAPRPRSLGSANIPQPIPPPMPLWAADSQRQ